MPCCFLPCVGAVGVKFAGQRCPVPAFVAHNNPLLRRAPAHAAWASEVTAAADAADRGCTLAAV
jgi:hypothetical protein